MQSSSSASYNLLIIGDSESSAAKYAIALIPAKIKLIPVSKTDASSDPVSPYKQLSSETLSSVHIVLCSSPHSRTITQALFPSLTSLVWLHSTHTGLDTLLFPELIAASSPSSSSPTTLPRVTLSNSRGLLSPALSEWVLSACLYFAKQLAVTVKQQHDKVWNKLQMGMLKGKTMVIVGMGDIGSHISRLALSFGMRVIGVRRSPSSTPIPTTFSSKEILVSLTQLSEALSVADYCVSVLPASKETENLINDEQFKNLKTDSVFINIGRGNTINQHSLFVRLRDGLIRGAALDVYDIEPLPSTSELYTLNENQIIISCHCANNMAEQFEGGMSMFLDHCNDFLNGGPLALKNRIPNPARGY